MTLVGQDSAAESQRTGDSALLEREQQLAHLQRAVAAAAAGTGSLVLIEGPAGIGKTALLLAAR